MTPDERRARRRELYKANRTKILARQKALRDQNREKVREQARARYQVNRDRILARGRVRRAESAATTGRLVAVPTITHL
jgi:hypothetical protein